MKTTIKNRRDQNMIIYVDRPEGEITGLVFVHHGFSGFADQPHIRLMSDCFLDKGYITQF